MKARKIYIGISCIMAMAFQMAFVAAAVYRIQIAGLAPYQLILVGTTLEISILIFETPTGVVADLKSRKVSVLIGLMVIGIGFAVEASFTYFVTIALAQLIWGLGYTFISGALDAWVSDELQDKSLERVLLEGAQYSRLFSILGILVAIGLGNLHVRIPMYTSAFLMILTGLAMVFMMPEEHFKVTKHDHSSLSLYFIQLRKALNHIFSHRILFFMIIIVFVYGLYSEGIDRLYELFILEDLDVDALLDMKPIWVIGGVNVLISIGSFIMLHLAKKRLDDSLKALVGIMVLTLLMISGILLFAYSKIVFVAISGFLIFRITREGTYPLLNAIQLKYTPSEIKATTLSAMSQTDAIGQLISGPLMVLVTTLFGIRSAFLFTALLLLLALAFLQKLLKYAKSI